MHEKADIYRSILHEKAKQIECRGVRGVIFLKILLLIPLISLHNHVLYIRIHVLLVFFFQIFYINRFAVFDHYAGLFDAWEVVFKNGGHIDDGNRDDRAAAFFGNLEAAAFKFQKGAGYFVASAFRKNKDGDAGLYLFDGRQNGL